MSYILKIILIKRLVYRPTFFNNLGQKFSMGDPWDVGQIRPTNHGVTNHVGPLSTLNYIETHRVPMVFIDDMYLLFFPLWPAIDISWEPLCIRYPALPLVHNGGFHGTPQRKPLSPQNFLIIFTPYVYTLITTIFQEKKYKIFVPFQNGGQITDFHFALFWFRPKFEKPLSQRNFSMKFGSN